MSVAHRPVKANAYQRRFPRTWWLANQRYLLFMVREVSSLFLAPFAVLYLVQIAVLAGGPDGYGGFIDATASPGWIAFGVIVLAFALVHSVTWMFQSASIFMQLGMLRAPRALLIVLGFLAWIGASVLVALVLLGGE
jgi:fumarate reductase subunit C